MTAPDSTPVWEAFPRWAAAHHASAARGVTDSEQDQSMHSAATIENELVGLQPVNARDIACLGYVALHVADCDLEGDNGVLLRGDCNPETLAFVSAVLGAFPEVAAVIMGTQVAA
mgnify:CR=1 FL=1